MSKVVDVVTDVIDPFGIAEKIWDETVGAVWDSLTPEEEKPDVATLDKGLQKGIDRPRRITFGLDRVGGVIIHQDKVTRDEKEFIQLVVLINGAPVDGLEEIYIANKPITDYPADSYDYEFSDGRQTTANSKALAKMAGWTDKHVGFGQAHIFIELENNREIFTDGISNTEFLIRGVRIYDPRDEAQKPDDEGTWSFSNNAVLCALHYVRFFGSQPVSMSSIPLDWWIAAANVADEQVAYTDKNGTEKSEPRYMCNGSFELTNKPLDILNNIERCFAGKVFRQMGQWFIRVGAWYGNPAITINPQDVAGNVKIKWHADLRDRANIVRATFSDPEQNYQRTDAPPIEAQGYIESDQTRLETSIALPFVRSVTQAQRLAKLHLEQTRLGTIELPLKSTGLAAAVGGTVYVNLPREHINNKIYRVVDRKYNITRGVTLVCIEDGPLLWSDDLIPGEVDITPNSDFTVGPPAPVVDLRVEVDADGNGIIKWTHDAPLSIFEFDVEFYAANNQVYKDAVTYTQATVPKLSAGEYSARVYARNIFGQRSAVAAVQFSVVQPTNPNVSVYAEYNLLTLTATLNAIGIGTQFQWQYLGTDENPVQSETVNAGIYTRVGLKPKTKYNFRVRAINHVGNSDWVYVSGETLEADLTEYVNDIPLSKLSAEAQNLIADLDKQVDRLRPGTENNIPDLLDKSVKQIEGLIDVTSVLDANDPTSIPAQIALNKIQFEESVLQLTDMQEAVLDVTSNYTNFRNNYEKRILNNERLIDAAVYVDPENGTITNRAYKYAEDQFTKAESLIDGVKGTIKFQTQRITATQKQLQDAQSTLEIQAGLIRQKATLTEVDGQIASAMAALQPVYSWQFNTSDEGFTGHAGHTSSYLISYGEITSPTIDYLPAENPVIRIRVRLHEGAQWLGQITLSDNTSLTAQAPATNDWEVITVDTSDLANNQITSLKLNLGPCDIDSIEIGKRGANDLALGDITARTTELEQELDAGTGRMRQYATTSWINGLGFQTQSNVQALIDSFEAKYSIAAVLKELDENNVVVKANAAQSWIDAANKTIRDAVISYVNEEGSVNDRLEAAYSEINALEGRIEQAVTQVQGFELESEEQDLNAILTAFNQLLRDNELQEQNITLAHASSQLQALAGDVESLAEQSTQLIAFKDQARAGLQGVAQAIANDRQAAVKTQQILKAEIEKQGKTLTAYAEDLTYAATGYCVDADGNRVDEANATSCELAGHTWVESPIVERTMLLAALMVSEQGYQTTSQVNQLISTFDAAHGITAVIQELNENQVIESVSAIEQWVDASEGYIDDRINIFISAEGGIGEQLKTANQRIDGLEGEISQSILQVQGLEIAQEESDINDVLAAYNQLLQQNELAQVGLRLAFANEKLTAKTTELEATSSKTLELAALFDNNQAVFQQVVTAFSNEKQANVLRDKRFSAFTESTKAGFVEVEEAFANQEQAFADKFEEIQSELQQGDTQALAAALTYTRAAVGYCVDADGNITNEKDAVLCVGAGHSWVEGPLAEYIRKLQIVSAEGKSASISDIRQAFETADGRLIARGGFLLNNEGKAVGVVGLNDGEIGSIDIAGDVIRQGAYVDGKFVPTSWLDNSDPANPQQVIRGRLQLGDHVVRSIEDIRALDGKDGAPGRDGVDGLPGRDGIDGKTTYTWVKYADDINGNGLSDYPSGKGFIGFAYNKLTHVESTNPAQYTWSKLTGDDGAPGRDGYNGTDGRTYYTWIAYSQWSNGYDLKFTPDATTKYIGIATNQPSPTPSSLRTHYQWSLFQGPEGPQGVPGKDGADGRTVYTWIRYADTASGQGISNFPDGKKYIGFAYNKSTSQESTNPADYTWSKIVGEDGQDGVPGEKGEDGLTTYTWIAYADNPQGHSMYQTPNEGTQYIGIAVNKTTPTESTNRLDYVWTRFRGSDGQNGTPGRDGTNGRDGSNGDKGPGFYVADTSTGTWSDSVANAATNGGSPVRNDVVTIFRTSNPDIQTTKRWTGSRWEEFALRIHGAMLVGTVIAQHLQSATGTFTGNLEAAGGTFKGNLEAASGTFKGTVYAENIEGDIAEIASKSISSKTIPAGVSSTVLFEVDIASEKYQRTCRLDPIYFRMKDTTRRYYWVRVQYKSGSSWYNKSNSIFYATGTYNGDTQSFPMVFQLYGNTTYQLRVVVEGLTGASGGVSVAADAILTTYKKSNKITFK